MVHFDVWPIHNNAINSTTGLSQISQSSRTLPRYTIQNSQSTAINLSIYLDLACKLSIVSIHSQKTFRVSISVTSKVKLQASVFSEPEEYHYQETVSYECNPGHEFHGPNRATCLAGRNFSVANIVCLPVTCSELMLESKSRTPLRKSGESSSYIYIYIDE